MRKFNQLKQLISSIESDAEKFYNKGNSAAGTRVRKGFHDVKSIAWRIRKEITELRSKGG